MIARWICFICILIFSLRMMFFLYAGISIDISDKQKRKVNKNKKRKRKKSNRVEKINIDDDSKITRRKIAK